ncbi:MAG: hypothetical protein J5651_08580 [Salinivirgaceae bacterium]|nr:hypothetical protein [Salinivirgaceae bacterium]MBR5166558.1 hypothetical protein [Salinivirgaceae bacterium]
MKLITKILVAVAIVLLLPVLIGFFLPRERQIERRDVIDQMYFYVLGNITNHWEEASWRHNLDTMIQVENPDGRDTWVEYYTNGDSVKLVTETVGESDYIRWIVRPDGRELLRSIVLHDYEGRTAIRMVEESYEPDPIKRFMALISDPTAKRIEEYLSDLKAKAIQQNEEMNSGDDDFFDF